MSTLGQGTEVGAIDLTFVASEVMANRFVAVKLDTTTAGQVSLAGDGESAIGILQTTAAAAGDFVTVRVLGLSLVKANGAFAIADLLNSAAATGKVDTKGSTEHAIAVALEAATAQDDEVLALIRQVYV